jgi:hypothetical protein
MALEHKLPFRLDTEALALGYYAVLDYNYKVVCECETLEEAEVFIAESNGSDIETVRRDAEKQSQMLHLYREKLKAKLKEEKSVKADGIEQQAEIDANAHNKPLGNRGVSIKKSTSNHGGGWSWNSLPDEIKQRFPSPPNRSKFSSTEEYEEACGYWQARVGRNIGFILRQYNNPIK